MVTSPHPSMCLILRLPKQLICLHSLLVYLKCCLGVGSVSTRYVYTDECFCVYMIEKAKTRVCVFVRVCIVCASMRGSLKRSFIQKHTVQGEMSDELFRDISHSRKRCFWRLDH